MVLNVEYLSTEDAEDIYLPQICSRMYHTPSYIEEERSPEIFSFAVEIFVLKIFKLSIGEWV